MLDLPEAVYQRVAVKAYQANLSVTEWVTKSFDNLTEFVAPTPLFPEVPAVVPPAPVPPAAESPAVPEPKRRK